MNFLGPILNLAETGRLPDAWIRSGIRRLLAGRLRDQQRRTAGREEEELRRFVDSLRERPVAEAVDHANVQHYEVPVEFFETVLGPRLKYSCCLWPGDGDGDLAAAEEEMLRVTAGRAEIGDDHDVLDLGCGWGSFTLWAAERFPGSRFTAVSNSSSQREFIERRAAAAGLGNVRAVTADVNAFDPASRFDRIVSVEMFEHMRNLPELLRRVRSWLRPDGRLFVHIFCHRRFAYLFESRGDADWMARHFFTGGMMPAEDLLPMLNEDLVLDELWRVNGRHYARTLRAWLDRLDARRTEVAEILGAAQSGPEGRRRLGRWRIFFMACEELFAWNGGEEWFVAHYRFRPRPEETNR